MPAATRWGCAQTGNAHTHPAVLLHCLLIRGMAPTHCRSTQSHLTVILFSLSPAPCLLQVFSDLSHVKMNGTKSMIGHCLGAGGCRAAP